MIARMRRDLSSDSGFTLMEMIVSLMIATVIFSAMAAGAIAGVRASVVARQNQQAVDVLNKVVEESRSMSYSALAMVSTDLSVNDSAISGGSYTVPNGVGAEEVWVDPTGGVNPHVETVTTDNGNEYTVKTYVTVPSGYSLDTAGQPDQKRLTVVTTWDTYGEERERVISTLLTETTRGLPLPRYGVTPTSPTTATKNPGNTLTWGFQVVNRGARDTFNVSASTGTWSYYVDDDCDGARDGTETTQLSNTDSATGDARPDTGSLEPNNYPPYCVVAERTIGASETGSSAVTFNFQSSAQPDVDGAAVSVGAFTVTVTTGSTGGSATPTPTGTGTATAPTTVCTPTPAGAGTPFGFRNGTAGTSGNSTSQLVNAMTENTCMNQPASANYSTEASSGTKGRSITTGGSATTTTASQRAEWRWAPASTRTVAAGTVTLSVMVSCPVAGGNVTLNGAVGSFHDKGSGTWTQRGTGSTSVSCATANTWSRVTIPMTVATSFDVTNKLQGSPVYLSGRVWVTGGSAGQTVRLDYEQPDAKSFLYANVS